MTPPDLPTALGAMACAAAGIATSVSLAGARRWSKRSDAAATQLHAALASHQASCTEQVAGLSRTLESVQAGLQTGSELLRDGRLNLSSRAQAMQLLRAGISPETAAITLGMASRELRLLARVSRILSAP
jgi:hypothetical protein